MWTSFSSFSGGTRARPNAVVHLERYPRHEASTQAQRRFRARSVGYRDLVHRWSDEPARGVIDVSEIRESIEVDVPVSVAYNQWTQFEEFPRFMEGVEEVRQVTDESLTWRGEIAGLERHWATRITEQVPDERIAWVGVEGEKLDGTVDFEPLGDDRARVSLTMVFEPDDALEKAADLLKVVEGRVKGDLERFKAFIEAEGRETGAWRGEIPADSPDPNAEGGTAIPA